jgi:putative ABC transport system substrate-binding protein
MKAGEVALSVILALTLLAAPLPAAAQQPGKVYRIGYLSSSALGHETNPQQCPIKGTPNWQALVGGLRERGYVQGQNLVIECRWTEGRYERAYQLAWELVELRPDLIVASDRNNARMVKAVTRVIPIPIPIVMVGAIDPEGWLVETLARPGGTLTGLAFSVGLELFGKQLELLKEAVPTASRVAVLNYGYPISYQGEFDAAARALSLTLLPCYIMAPEELAHAFARMTTVRADALVGEPDSFFFAYRHRIAELAAQHRLPALFPYRALAEAGALMSFGPNEPTLYRRVGAYVDKIFKGAKPGDLPVEQPTKYELIINLKTAKALGLTIPQSLLLRADEVIE